MNEEGLLFVFSAPSGAGKSTILNQIVREDPNLEYSISATTRKPRKNEINGKDYFFMEQETFERNICGNKMLEYDIYCGNYYGTLISAVDEPRKNGTDVILEITVDGAMKVKKIHPESILVFISPPSLQELEKRIRRRGTENEDVIKNRLSRAEEEMKHAKDYDYIVINDCLDKAINDIKNIIKENRLKRRNLNYDE
jgi:guanylate kinase